MYNLITYYIVITFILFTIYYLLLMLTNIGNFFISKLINYYPLVKFNIFFKTECKTKRKHQKLNFK